MNETIKLDKSSTALVIIDLQKGIIGIPTQPYDTGTVISNAAKFKSI